MSIHKQQPQTLATTTRQDSALNAPNAMLRGTQGTYGGEVTMGSDCGSCKEAPGRRSTRGERDAGARVPSKLGDASSGLVSLKKQRESILITPEHADMRRAQKMRLVVLGAATGIESGLQADGYRYRVGFVTLTYANDDDWQPGDIKELIRHYRLWAKRRGEPFRCVWVAELTKRYRVHYHICFWLRCGLTPPKPDKQGWWRKGMTQVQWARRPVGYLVKYASKGLDAPSSGRFPSGARLYGVGGAMGHLGWFRSPGWLRRRFGRPGDKIIRRGSWWCNHSNGIAYRSPWILDTFDHRGAIARWVGWTEEDVWFLFNGLPKD
jgi:hypothetical protein